MPNRWKWNRLARPRKIRRQEARTKTQRQPPYNVILWDDQNHTHAYVIVMLQQLFGYPPTKGFQLADEVDRRGRAIVATTTLEHAELKRDQIRAFGKDILNTNVPARCTPRSSRHRNRTVLPIGMALGLSVGLSGRFCHAKGFFLWPRSAP